MASSRATSTDAGGESNSSSSSDYVVLVTGANSGLGFDICRRVIDEFPATPTGRGGARLVLVCTTRSEAKARATVGRLEEYVRRRRASAPSSASARPARRVLIRPEQLDLCSLASVRRLARRLGAELPRVDAAVLNAGVGGWSGVRFWEGVWAMLTGWVQATTYPGFKVQVSPTRVLGPQIARAVADGGGGAKTPGEKEVTVREEEEEPQLAELFCANLFGHYVLAHELMPLLSGSAPGRRHQGQHQPSALDVGRIVFVSSLEAYAHALRRDDLQALRDTHTAYEAVKRLTDVLALTYAHPAVAPYSRSFFSLPSPSTPSAATTEPPATTTANPSPPRILLSHPGVCATSIIPLSPLYSLLNVLAAHIARLLGSPWHTVSSYNGAAAMAWLALAPLPDIEHAERDAGPGPGQRAHDEGGDDDDEGDAGVLGGRAKWGSTTTRLGCTTVTRTEVEGYGWAGRAGEEAAGWEGLARRRGRRVGAPRPSAESRAEFVEEGRWCWREMEEMREGWERRLDRAGL